MSNHTPGPWMVVTSWCDHMVEGPNGEAIIWQDGPYDTPTIKLANARLIAAAPDLLEAAIVQQECGLPSKVTMYDEDGCEGWLWQHPDGREWMEIGDWSEPPALHPLMRTAIAKAKGGGNE